jgi:hypothetical protein
VRLAKGLGEAGGWVGVRDKAELGILGAYLTDGDYAVLCCAVRDLPNLVWVTLADRLGGEEKRVLSKWSGHGGVGLGSVECTLLALRPLPLVLIPFMAGGGWGSSI